MDASEATMATRVSRRSDLTVASVNPGRHDEERMDALRMAALLVTLALSPPAAHAPTVVPTAYTGTGAWIDRYDFARLEDATFAAAEMADHGVKTLYVETASWVVPGNADIVAP